LALFSYDDEISPARVITNFAKNRESITVTAGILEGNLVGMETVTAFASLPSREELLAKLVGSINAPVSGFVNVLAANLRGLVQVLGAIKEQKA
ncbi:MAG: 50S ribosomal protein L10, partial [bacterium]|nr:50S ribosomal protein L10 [bacterium]